MKRFYLILTIIGFFLPNYLVLQESLASGNILLYAQPMNTLAAMFANRIASVFAIDLLFGVFVFFVWSGDEQGKNGWKKLAISWSVCILFGFASGLPLYLYLRQTRKGKPLKASTDP
ncbi:MAG: DUF2834 domain-containing protein [Bacteroidota bacterium]